MQTKITATARKKIHNSVSPKAEKGMLVLIERNSKILMQKRSEHIADPGTWVLPGMSIITGQKHADCITQSCLDELGIIVEPIKKIGMLNLPEYRCPVWHVQCKEGQLKMTNNDTAAAGWFTLEELETLAPVRHQDEFRSFLQKHATHETLDLSVEEDIDMEEDRREEAKQLAELILRAQQDDHEAFAVIYDKFATAIFRYVSFRVPATVAEDLVADIFVKAWEKLHTYKVRKGIPFSSWLFRIARNTVIDSYRTFRETIELDDLKADDSRWNDPTLQITHTIQSAVLRQAMHKLPKRYREVLSLSFLSELNNTEVARALKIREGSMRIIKHRALKKLQEWLPASMKEELP